MTQMGFIGLQVHGVGKRTDSVSVSWRGLKIKDLGYRKWLPLFDGKGKKGQPFFRRVSDVDDIGVRSG